MLDFLFATTLGKATAWVSSESALRMASAPGASGGKKRCRWTWRGRRCKEAAARRDSDGGGAQQATPPSDGAWSVTSLAAGLVTSVVVALLLQRLMAR